MGADIDFLQVHGRSKSTRAGQPKRRAKDEKFRTNFEQYGMASRWV